MRRGTLDRIRTFSDLFILVQDENGDDEITVQELTNWIHTNKLVQLASEGRDVEMDRIMESHTTESSDSESADSSSAEGKSESGMISQKQP